MITQLEMQLELELVSGTETGIVSAAISSYLEQKLVASLA